MRFQGFIGPGYTLQSIAADCQRCVNWYPEINELQTAADGEVATLVQIPGQKVFATLGTGPIRGIHATSTGKLLVVSGSSVYRVGADGSSSIAGTLYSNSGRVVMEDNGTQILITDGTLGYIYDMNTATFTPITADGFLGATTVAFQDGYFIAQKSGSNQFNISGSYDGLAWDALDFGVAEGSPDNLVAVVSNLRQLWLFGEQSTEVWWDSGDANFPFTRIDGAFIEYGCAAPLTARKFNNSVVWLGGGPRANGIVWIAQGFTPKRISNHAVEYAIQQCSDLSTASAEVYQENGHVFYVLNLPDGKTSWVYDSATEQWHERQSYYDGVLARYRSESFTFCYEKHLAGDYQNGNVYQMDNTVYTDNGQPIVRIRRSPHIVENLSRVFYSKLVLDATVGVGLDGAPVVGENPVVLLSWSDDAGMTWSAEVATELGAVGEYRTRMIYTRLGMAYNRVFQVAVADPVKVTLLGADITFKVGAA